MSVFSDLRDELATEFIAAGFWEPIRVTDLASPPVSVDCYAAYRRPDNLKVNGTLSNDHWIEYQAADLPTLAEGHLVTRMDENGDPIAGEDFRVREAPFVTDDPASDTSGYFMRAILTKL